MKRRASDKGPLCWLALRAGQFWDFVDKRDIDKHTVSVAIMYGTVKITGWAMLYADLANGKPGLEVAAILGAVLAPWMALQAAAIRWYFEARTNVG